MSLSGSCDVTPGTQLSSGQKWTTALLNLLGRPTVRVAEGAIGSRELAGDDVKALVPQVVRNVIINGNFDIWQRGGFANLQGLPAILGASADAEYTADRWIASEPNAGVATRQIYREAFDLDQVQVPNSPSYYMRWAQTSADTGISLGQPIEDVRTLAGQDVTLTWWMKSDTSGSVIVKMGQFFGGSPGLSVVITANTGGTSVVTGGGAWQQYEAHFSIPTLAGHTIGGENSSVGVSFYLPENATYVIDFAQVQLEQSTVATNFETHSAAYEMERCQRYFEYSSGVTQIAQISTLTFPIQLDAMTTAAADLVTNYVPGYPFKILAVDFATTKLGAGAGATQTLNLEIGTTNLTGGVVNPTLSGTDTLGKMTAGTAVTAANVGSATDSISVEVATGGVVFTGGSGTLLIKVQRLDALPCFYFNTRKYRSPDITALSGLTGTGATFGPVLDVGYRQLTEHSIVETFYVQADAEIV